jgi:signal peptidase I
MAKSDKKFDKTATGGKSKDTSAKDDSKNKSDKDKSSPAKYGNQENGREMFESIVVAFVLAFLFRAFEAEAFVIPTGSMAPTLFGRHKEANCEMCHFHFAFGASDEIDDSTGYFNSGRRIRTALCPNCRFENPVKDLAVFKGDRILVTKFPYEFGDPERWDVPVFKYPEHPTTNYIKRMVGLPGEKLAIRRGDVYRIEKDRTWTTLRKPPSRQKALQLPVYDNNHPETLLHESGWPKRWAPVAKTGEEAAQAQRKDLDLGPIAGWSDDASGWEDESETHSFRLDAGSDSLKWIRYRHIVPTASDWEQVTSEFQPEPLHFAMQDPVGPRAQLITDFCGYNSYTGGNGDPRDDFFWVGDLTVSFTAEILDATGELLVELNEGVRCYRCRIDVATGKARLISVEPLFDGDENVIAEAQTDVAGADSYDIRFANVDARLCLWVDDSLVDFGEGASYLLDDSIIPNPIDKDLIPVGIAGQGLGVRVSNLFIERDTYYRASRIDNDDDDHFHWRSDDEHPDPDELRRHLTNPEEWARLYTGRHRDARFTLAKFEDVNENGQLDEGEDFNGNGKLDLDEDEYLMLGDNSPRSQDSRVWPNTRRAARRHAVPRSALVGKAFYIYWPHGKPFMNGGQGFANLLWSGYHQELTPNGVIKTDYVDNRFPFYPDFFGMKRIR